MIILQHREEQEAREYLFYCVELAQKATCKRSRCGSIIVKDGDIIGAGINTPPAELETQRRCLCSKDSYHRKVTDKTCCIHAEQRAIMDALRKHPDKIINSRLYFLRLDEKGERSYAANPYCTICSKMALDVGIKEFVLWHKEGISVYSTQEYNILSYAYQDSVL
ncbi:MAG: hypothetical protein PHU61_01475 [Candidatus Absconditabacteria bacterium]|nr:hypothetical protein [Candidatus Absconditabacteria bacterium]MDD3868030.1 hypothetical protein [Candidatus Absconditabacteria bacterium]MDD4714277.1 hypothetical protein [Candidatus Absconditabacteria bacterium]